MEIRSPQASQPASLVDGVGTMDLELRLQDRTATARQLGEDEKTTGRKDGPPLDGLTRGQKCSVPKYLLTRVINNAKGRVAKKLLSDRCLFLGQEGWASGIQELRSTVTSSTLRT